MTELFGVLVGGALAIMGGFLQTWLSKSWEKRNARQAKREEAYLGYIEALVKLRISDETGIIKMNEFWNKFYLIQAKLRMYGSSRIIKQATEFEEHLYECWECGNNDIGGTEELRDKLIKSIRKEANID